MNETDLRWAVVQRYEFLEWRVYWTGRVNRKDLETQFQISTPQASIVLRDYQQAAPDNLVYDKSEKAYVAGHNFRPVFLKLSPERYLLQLQALEAGAIRKRDTWFETVPPIEVATTIVRGPEAYTLRALVRAIQSRAALDIYYRSLTRDGMRTICPHAFVHDGYRWHCRAFSVERGEFRDYVLGRILSISEPKPCDADASDDVEWTTHIELKIKAHPRLDIHQREAIEHDYRMEDGALRIKMRLAAAFYFVKRYNLDLQNTEIAPARIQLWLDNLDELNNAVKKAKEQTKILVARRSALRDQRSI
ncbi:MAG: WYL domain-containing protein [Alphaproteobacteria bacterium]